MAKIITNYLVYIIEFFIVYMYFSFIAEKKRSSLFTFGLGFVLFSAISFLNPMFQNNIIINCVSFLIICAVFGILSFNIAPLKSTFHSIILFSLMMCSEFVAVFLISAIMGMDPGAYRTNYTVYIIDAVFSKTLFLFLAAVLTRIIVQKDSVRVKIPVSFFLYPVCTIGLLIIMRMISIRYVIPYAYNKAIAVVSFALLFSTVLIFISYSRSLKRENEIVKLQSENERAETDKTYFDILAKQNEELQVFAHDTKNHLAMIKSLSHDEQIDKYISAIYDDLNEYNSVGKTGNKMLDLIINKYQTLCRINDITFETDIKNSNLDFVEDRDLSTILNNALDNAVEASLKSEKKHISITIKHSNSFDVLSIVNSSDSQPDSKGNLLITSKSDRKIHGYGTKSIKKAVAKYNGETDWRYDNSSKEFHLNIMFNCNEKGA